MLDNFWDGIRAQLIEIQTAKTARTVIEILNRFGPTSSGDAFFAGSGGDDGLDQALYAAGWKLTWLEASYHWVMTAPDGTSITYIEGDVFEGDTHREEVAA